MPPDHQVPGLLEALPELEASLRTDRTARNVVRVAEALRLAGQAERAVDLLESLVDSEPTLISPLVLLAWCQEDVGETDRARTIMDQVRSLDPGNPFARPTETTPTEVPFQDSPFVEAAESEEIAEVDSVAESTSLPPSVEESPPDAESPSVQAPAIHEPPTPPAMDPEMEAEPERALSEQELRDVPPSPLYSATLAEIFERQGFEQKAIEIYEEVVRLHPERADLRARIADLRRSAPEDAAS